jgi:hypothetical protein
MRIGYFGVILPYYEFWQGYFLDDSAKDDAEGFIKQIRSNFDNIYMPPSAVIRPIEYISEKDQSLIGAVSSVVVDFAAKQDNERIGTASMALHLLTGFLYYCVNRCKRNDNQNRQSSRCKI